MFQYSTTEFLADGGLQHYHLLACHFHCEFSLEHAWAVSWGLRMWPCFPGRPCGTYHLWNKKANSSWQFVHRLPWLDALLLISNGKIYEHCGETWPSIPWVTEDYSGTKLPTG